MQVTSVVINNWICPMTIGQMAVVTVDLKVDLKMDLKMDLIDEIVEGAAVV